MKNKNKKIQVGLSGASGRMGRAVKELMQKKGFGFSLVAQVPPLDALEEWNKNKVEGVIDFSSPELFEVALHWSMKNQKPFVSGTTALGASHKKLIKLAVKKIPVFYEENMSWGIWQIKKWINNMSEQVPDTLLEDIHHKNKKDKPSGTALKLQRSFPSFVQKKLKIKSIRKGREFGTHRIYFKGEEEVVLLEHKVLSRRLFAGGALRALKWLMKKPPGLYSFEDIYRK